MDLVIGGAFQGKTQWAIHQFGLTEGDIFVCGETGIPIFLTGVSPIWKITHWPVCIWESRRKQLFLPGKTSGRRRS